SNLGCICRFHHKIKHMPGWTCTQDTEGTFTWTSPTGEIFTVRPPPANGEEPPEFGAPEEDPEPCPF
ncbi:MAG: HNH endonuclease, partial [Sporichthya sp.]|nr:HNH endonuclease [Sporichthya sp.]